MTQFDLRSRLADLADDITPGPAPGSHQIEAEARRLRQATRTRWTTVGVAAAVAAIAIPIGVVQLRSTPAEERPTSAVPSSTEMCLPAAAAVAIEMGRRIGVADTSCKVREIPVDGRPGSPVLSPDEDALAYVRFVNSERKGVQFDAQLVVKNLTTGQEQIVLHSNAGYIYEPAWSPDGRRLAFAYDDLNIGQAAIWVYDFQTEDFNLINRGSTSQNGPQWSPDGERLAFGRSGDPTSVVITTTRDPEETDQITVDLSGKDLGSVIEAVWSPDGTRLAALYHETDEDGENTTYQLLVLDAESNVLARSDRPLENVGSIGWIGDEILISGEGETLRYDENLDLVATAPIEVTFN